MDFASLILGVVLGGLVSWWISAMFYKRSTADMKLELARLGKHGDRRDTLESFEQMLVSSHWRREIIDQRPVWICEQRSSFRIVPGNAFEPFAEEWTEGFSDKNSRSSDVELRINESTIKSLRFIHLDGHRIVVPMPRILAEPGGRHFYWEADSIEFKVGAIIGEYYIHNNVEAVARLTGVSIVRERGRG